VSVGLGDSVSVGTAVTVGVGIAVSVGAGTEVSEGCGASDAVSVTEGSGTTVCDPGSCASLTVTPMAAASGASDTMVGVGAGGNVMVGWSTPIITVLPSERTVDCTVAEGVTTVALS
jgi:hypothetical protein